MATFIKANGEQTEVQPKNGRDFKLGELQAFVGGDIEIWDISDGRQMVMNENGLIIDLPINEEASRLFQDGFSQCKTSKIRGDVLVCEQDEIK